MPSLKQNILNKNLAFIASQLPPAPTELSTLFETHRHSEISNLNVTKSQ